MRAEEFEAADIVTTIRETLIRDCQPFLTAIDHDITKYALWRGVTAQSAGIDIEFKKLAVNKNRKPLNTIPEIHNIVDEYFAQYHGLPWRSQSVFACGDHDMADAYGTLCLFVPIGRFKFLWTQSVFDLFLSLNKVLRGTSGHPINFWLQTGAFNAVSEDMQSRIRDSIRAFLKQSDYQGVGLKNAILSGNEIMFDCNEYYLINLGGMGLTLRHFRNLQ